ncbi:hypothetical protein [Roseivirga sp.]|uniref:hypothetical protein n=1 Tax=Roseivirga sp. TaxID=1964215 RepID=UPI003B8C298D
MIYRPIALQFCVFLFSLSVFAQKSKEVVNVQDFDREHELEKILTTININGEIWQAHNMSSNGQYIFVLNADEVPPVKSYRLSDGEFMGGFASKGGGPGEFQMFNPSGFGIRKGQLMIQGLKYVRIYDIVDGKEKVDLKLSFEFKAPPALGIINQGFFVDDNTLAGAVEFKPKEFVTFNIRPETEENYEPDGDFGDYPSLYPDIPNTAYHHLYAGMSSYSGDGRFLAKAYMNFPMIRLFELPSGAYTDINFEAKNQQASKIVADKAGMSIRNSFGLYSYQDNVKMSENLIVSHYRESLAEKITTNGVSSYQWISQAEPFLLVFNLKGKLLAKLSLPDWFQSYTLTPDGRMIVFHPEIENKLFITDLKQFK